MKSITRKSLLYRSDVEYSNFCLNHVKGCSHGCTFPCYAFNMAKRIGRVKSYQEWREPKLVENALELLDKENLLAFLSETGFFKKGVYSSIEDETVVQPANLEIVFASAPQNLAKLYMVGESVPFQSYGYKYDISNNTLRVFLYYSTKVREEVSAEKPHYGFFLFFGLAPVATENRPVMAT